ncbi:MAG: DUF2339 domain-containing protein, partial [Massilia sp.]
MKHVVFGNALSALGFGVFYTVLAMVLWRRRAGKLKLLVESFLALGLVFGTLALPFALDGRWTSAAWALEGAGVAWVGLRQRQRLVFGFGMLVQAGAWISFIGAISGLAPQAARDSNLWLGFLILAITAFFMATTFRAQKEGDEPMYPRAASWLLGIAAIWFMGGAWTEIFLRQSDTALANMLVVSGLATAALLAVIARRMQWENASRFSLVAQTVAGVTLLCVMMENWDWDAARNPFDRPLLGTLMIFAGALFTSWNIFRMPSSTAIARLGKVLLAWAAFWWFLPILDILHGSLWWQLGDQGTSTADGSFSLYLACVALSGVLFAVSARRLAWPDLRRLSVPAWIAMVLMTVVITSLLYQDRYENLSINWVCFALCWSASEFLLRLWPASAWPIRPRLLKLVHLVRTAGPWILLWKVGANAIEHWLRGADQDQQLLSDAGINASASWASFVPFWLMMAALMWLIKRSRAEQWPVAPIAAWYRRALIPAATAWSLLLVAAWNMFQDGTMAPLPYVPLANPLDISTGFALFVAVFSYRQLKAEGDTLPIGLHKLVQRLPMAGAVLTYVWLNLILLRTASHVLDITYNLPTLFDSQIVQAMLSLVWSITALVLMRLATRKLSRKQWMVGAAFLALVVAKLFLVDQASTGSVARIVAFIGVGLLMVLIAYLAPYPAAPAEPSGE